MGPAGSLLIDGYNLLHASDVFGVAGRTSLERSREALLDTLAGALDAGQRERTTIVFDARDAPPGLPRLLQREGMTIRFAPRGQEADEVIEALIREHHAPRSLTVVSSDHRLQRAARRRRATAVDSDRWWAELSRRPDRPAGAAPPSPGEQETLLSPDEVADWLELFQFDPPPDQDRPRPDEGRRPPRG